MTIAYAGVWLALALLFSIFFRSAATAALVALGLWLFLTILWPLISPYLAALFVSDTVATPAELLSHLGVLQAFARVSPGALFGEIVGVAARSDGAFDPAAAPCLTGLGPGATRLRTGRAAAVAAKHRGGVAADRRHDRRRDPLVCHRICNLPAAGSPRLALAVRQPLKTVEGGRQAALDAFAVAPFVDTLILPPRKRTPHR